MMSTVLTLCIGVIGTVGKAGIIIIITQQLPCVLSVPVLRERGRTGGVA